MFVLLLSFLINPYEHKSNMAYLSRCFPSYRLANSQPPTSMKASRNVYPQYPCRHITILVIFFCTYQGIYYQGFLDYDGYIYVHTVIKDFGETVTTRTTWLKEQMLVLDMANIMHPSKLLESYKNINLLRTRSSIK